MFYNTKIWFNHYYTLFSFLFVFQVGKNRLTKQKSTTNIDQWLIVWQLTQFLQMYVDRRVFLFIPVFSTCTRTAGRT